MRSLSRVVSRLVATVGHRRWALACLAAIIMFAGGCTGQSSDGGGHGDGDALFPRLPKVSGHIDEVTANPENPRHFRVLRITDEDGQRWEFQSEGWVGVPVGHLKDHQIQGAVVTVWYEEQGGGVKMARFVAD